MAVNAADVASVVQAARGLPPAESSYIETDFVKNMMETVLDYMMQTPVVVRALEHYQARLWNEIRTLDDLEDHLADFEDDQVGNTALAQSLWGYNLWTRAHQLRDLAAYFRSVGVIDQPSLQRWAERADFKRDFEGRIKGLGIAVFQWLVMRQGVETVKPDVHVRRFAEAAVGRALNDTELIECMRRAADELGLKAYQLDWRVWEASRGGALPYPGSPP